MKRETGLSTDLDPEDSIETRSWTGLLKISAEQSKGSGCIFLLTEIYQVLHTWTRYTRCR
jgi:hypothetical protein